MTKEINGVSMDEIKSHYDYGIRSDEDVVRKILRDRRKAKYYPVFENIKKQFDETDAKDKIEISYVDNGLNIDVKHNTKNNILGEYQSLLRIENYFTDEYHYSIEIYDNDYMNEDYIINYPGIYPLDEKTTDVNKMIADIKDFYKWD